MIERYILSFIKGTQRISIHPLKHQFKKKLNTGENFQTNITLNIPSVSKNSLNQILRKLLYTSSLLLVFFVTTLASIKSTYIRKTVSF